MRAAAAAKEEKLASPSAEEIFSLAAGVAAALETHAHANAARDEKSHQGIFSKNRTPRVSSIWGKWSATHQDRSLAWSETVLGPTIYLYDGDEASANVIEEIDNSGNVLARYTQGPGIDQPLAQFRSGTSSYYQQDALSSVTSLSNSSGALANSYTYDSFGKLTASTGTLTNPFRYAGRDFDDESGLFYNRARYYSSTFGRFISEDPIGFADGPNVYSYVHNSPLNFRDPLGLSASSAALCFLKGAASGAAGAAIVAGVAVAVVAAGAPVAAVTVGLGAVAIVGTAVWGWETGTNIANSNWNGLAYDIGSAVGGSVVGG